MTLTEYLEQWLARQRLQVQPATWTTYQQTPHCHIAPALGGVALRALEPAQIERFYVDMLNVSDRAVLPRIDPRATGSDDTKIRVWTAAQARRFLDLTADDEHRDLWAVALGTGMRRGELLGLRWIDVADDHRQVRVARSLTVVDGQPRLKTTKTQRVRRLRLDPRTASSRPPRCWNS